ncbi:ankyrin repeat-containing domain protein [Pyronema domesticum]|nr:ankyrin repeat-containing domain protein [Pyronema domesticum]
MPLLSIAACCGLLNVIHLLINKGYAADERDCIYERTPLSYAAEFGQEAVVRYLCEQCDVDINKGGGDRFASLLIAGLNNHWGIVEFLLSQRRIDINSQDGYLGQSILTHTMLQGPRNVLKLLLSHPDINVNIQCPFYNHSAVYYCYSRRITRDLTTMDPLDSVMEKLAILLSHRGCTVVNHVTDECGDTALHGAAMMNNYKVLKLLLPYVRSSNEINFKDKSGRTALIFVSENSGSKSVEILLSHLCIDVNLKNIRGRTALSSVANRLSREVFNFNPKDYIDPVGVAKCLSSRSGLKVNLKDKTGNTALALASRLGNVEIVQQLLSIPTIKINTTNKDCLNVGINEWPCGNSTALLVSFRNQD